jgi:hypothetical protein
MSAGQADAIRHYVISRANEDRALASPAANLLAGRGGN